MAHLTGRRVAVAVLLAAGAALLTAAALAFVALAADMRRQPGRDDDVATQLRRVSFYG
jgi:hypothetical protein